MPFKGTVTVSRMLLLRSCYDCDSRRQHYDVTRFKYVLWRRTMHLLVMNIQYQTWIAQGRFINMIRTPSKQWGMCDNCWVSLMSKAQLFNTFRQSQNYCHFADILKWIFLNENVWISLKISSKFVSKVQINNIPALVEIMAWCQPGNKALSEPMMATG